jgi:hypothetical protein
MNKDFFGSKLNTVLLSILIILMAIAIYLMLQNRELYLHPLNQPAKVDYQIFGNKADLVSFSILPGQEVSGKVKFTGELNGGYFFEGGSIAVNVVTVNQQLLERGTATPTSDWTKPPVSFNGTLDFTTLPKGLADIRIMNDNESGLAKNDKNILIPINIE